MKKIIFLLLVAMSSFAQTPHPQGANLSQINPVYGNKKLTVSGTLGGFVPPKVTMVQRNNIVSPTIGELIFQTDNIAGFRYYDGTQWVAIASGQLDYVPLSGTESGSPMSGAFLIDTSADAVYFYSNSGDGQASLDFFQNSEGLRMIWSNGGAPVAFSATIDGLIVNDGLFDRGLQGDTYYASKQPNDFAQMADIASSGVSSVTGNIVDNTDPDNPVVTGVASVTGSAVGGTSTNPVINTPIVSLGQVQSSTMGYSIQTNTDPTGITLLPATSTPQVKDGIMSGSDKVKLDGISSGATSVTVDAIPTDGSANAVSSNGVFDALALTSKVANRIDQNNAATTSSQLASTISDETGTGALVFANSPALLGAPTFPTATAGTNSTQGATTAFVATATAGKEDTTNKVQSVGVGSTSTQYPSALAIQTQNLLLKSNTYIDFVGKNMYFYGDSYTIGTGTVTAATRFSTRVAQALNAIESNFGVAGTTLEKRALINYAGSPNMVDNVTAIPTYVQGTMSMLVFAYGLNDAGYTVGGYSTVNFKLDYDTVITNATGKGWPVNRILIVAPFYASQTGLNTAYGPGVVTGNVAPTQAYVKTFEDAAREVALKYGTFFFGAWTAQENHNIAQLQADGLHATPDGHDFYAKAILEILPGKSAYYGFSTPTSTTIPAIFCGNGFGASLAQCIRVSLYNAGTASENDDYGIGTFGTNVVVKSPTGGGLQIAANNTQVALINGTASVFNSTVQVATPTATGHAATKGYVDGLQPLTGSATLDFPSIAAQSQSGLTITVTGAVVGKPVSVGMGLSALTAGVIFNAYVSATNTVTVMASNITSSAKDPASDTFTVSVSR